MKIMTTSSSVRSFDVDAVEASHSFVANRKNPLLNSVGDFLFRVVILTWVEKEVGDGFGKTFALQGRTI